MANPTTNYSFAMPTNSDLVKDLPADFDIFGQAVDDRIKALNPETTAGDISYRASTANAKSRLAIGTAGQVLTVNSGATAPEWTTLPAAGGQTLISTATLTNATAISFTSIPTTYKHLRFIFQNVYSSSSYWDVTFNNVTTGGHYKSQASAATQFGGNSTANAAGAGGVNSNLGIIPATFNGNLNGTADGYMEIYNYASTTVQRTGNWAVTGYGGTLGGYYCVTGAFNYSNNGTAITRVDFVRGSTQTVNGTIELWGIA